MGSRTVERTQVGIVGAGPAGLVLALLLRRHGIASIVLETRSRAYCEQRIRAGVLEHGTVELLEANGVGQRMRREGLVHHGIYLRFGGRSRHVDFPALTGKTITVYGQHEVVKDLIAAHVASGEPLHFDVSGVQLHGLDGERPAIRYRDAAGEECEIACDFVAGCDGFHGVARGSIPDGVLTAFERVYPFAWLGILSESPPVCDELIYTRHDRGFALFSQRSPSVQRMYLQCAPDENLAAWSDDRIWDELHRRLEGDDPPELVDGTITQKGVTAMRSFVVEPMQYGRLFLAGDAAHIVPPTGAKGMNLAVADVAVLAHALDAFYARGDAAALAAYSATCLRRVWRAERFSAWMTSMLTGFPTPIRSARGCSSPSSTRSRRRARPRRASPRTTSGCRSRRDHDADGGAGHQHDRDDHPRVRRPARCATCHQPFAVVAGEHDADQQRHGDETVDDRRPEQHLNGIEPQQIGDRRRIAIPARSPCRTGAPRRLRIEPRRLPPKVSASAYADEPASTGTASSPAPTTPSAKSSSATCPASGRSASRVAHRRDRHVMPVQRRRASMSTMNHATAFEKIMPVVTSARDARNLGLRRPAPLRDGGATPATLFLDLERRLPQEEIRRDGRAEKTDERGHPRTCGTGSPE